jgi:REP element-mobilizing transposase RayT
MAYDPQKHHRRSVRLKGFDYRSGGAYFVTICTHNRECIFGTIENDAMNLSQRGMIVQQCWHDIPNHRPNVELDAFQIMPNHVHGIIWLVGATHSTPTRETQKGQNPS